MPEGLRTSTAPTRAYELVHDIGGSEQARFAVLVDWSDIRVADRVAFEESRKELFELRQRHVKGFVANRLLRSLGDWTKYLVVQLYISWNALPQFTAEFIPELQAFGRAHQAGDYTDTPNQRDTYEILRNI